VGVSLKNTEKAFLLHDPGLELDVLDDGERCIRYEYGPDAQSRDEDGAYVGLHVDHIRVWARNSGGENGAKGTTCFFLYANDEDHSLAWLLTAFASI
jgi:hypothetical protein